MAAAAARRTAQNHGALKENKGNGKLPVFDLDAYQAEAAREPFCFSLGGQVFELPHMADMDWHAAVDADGNPDSNPTVHALLRAGLGDQWKDFDKHKVTAGAYNELWRRWQEHSGTNLGEFAASQP